MNTEPQALRRARQDRAQGPRAPLAEFQPLHRLWDGPHALFPSEQSARWQLRHLRPALAEAGALARWCGRLHYHPVKFAAVAEQHAIAAARRAVV